jgi:hypothetical protein
VVKAQTEEAKVAMNKNLLVTSRNCNLQAFTLSRSCASVYVSFK